MSSTERLNAALAGRYKIEKQLGQGGMATVYLAKDIKHDRMVAVKVLKPELAAVLGAERFVVEIKTTAALQHPHILPLFDSGTADGFLYYVMPYIEGETLRGKLNRETQFSVDEAVRITAQVADALDYAHRHGVIHRDIKPENILLHDGRPMVADFGIALAVSAAAGGRMTETGLSLGTPHYMSPEQATAEKEITGRSDIYSLASVMYEMLAGAPPHMGASAQQIIMKIITEQAAPVTNLRKAVPPNVAAALERALQKLPADRFETAKAFGEALVNRTFTSAAFAGTAVPGHRSPFTGHAFVASSSIAALAIIIAAWGWLRPSSHQDPLGRFEIVIPGASGSGVGYESIAVSRDGRDLVYQDATAGLIRRRRGELATTVIKGGENANGVFFSPDGTQVGFVTGYPGSLVVLPLTGGVARVVVKDSALAFGCDWTSDGTIYYTAANGSLMRVAAEGGASKLIARPDTARGEASFVAPSVLPGGKAALVGVNGNGPTQIVVLDLASGDKRAITAGTIARFSAPDYIVFSRSDGALYTLPFDAGRGVATGPELPLGDQMSVASGGAVVAFALSDRGELFYVAGFDQKGTIVRVDRTGRARPVDPSWTDVFSGLVLSPDGKRLAVSKSVEAHDEVWLKQLDRGPLSRVAFGGLLSYRPFWSPNGASIGFLSDRDGAATQSAYTISATGGGDASVLLMIGRVIDEAEWSRDGKWLIYRAGSGGSRDIYAQRWGSKDPPVTVAATPAEERAPTLSPDGRFIAYVSSESNTAEVYVRPFPNAASARWQVSTHGGTEPRWSRSGRELFYRNLTNDLVSARIGAGETFNLVSETSLFSTNLYRADNMHFMFDVLPDDQGFVFIQANQTAGRLIAVQNWRAIIGARTAR